MRSLTWSASAQFIVSAVGFAVPLIIVSVLLTNLPAPQLTYGEMFEPLKRSESVTGVSPSAPSELATALPREQPGPSAKPFLQAFGAVSQTDFLTLFLCLTLGAAALPSLLARSGVTSSVADQRRSVAWGVFFVALFAISAPALAAFVRLLMFQDIAQAPANALPSWLNDLSAYRLLFTKDANTDGAIEASELFVARDGIVLALPMAAKLPFVCTVLTAAAGLAIALAAAASHLFTLAGSLADDVIRLVDPRSEVLPRLMVAWVAIAATALAAGVFLAFAEIDVMQVAIMAFASAAAIFFPVLLLAIWWRRCTWLGAMLALGLGFATMATAIAFGGCAHRRSVPPHHGDRRADRRCAWADRGPDRQPARTEADAGRASLFRGTARSVRRCALRSRATARGGGGKSIAVFTPQQGRHHARSLRHE